MREVISLHFGQCGCQIGNAVWELFTTEHNIRPDGTQMFPNEIDRTFESFFEVSSKDQYVPRAIFCDLEPTVIDEIRTGHYRSLYHDEQLISGQEDASNNFARGFFTIGKLYTDVTSDRLNKIMECCDCPQAFMIYRSLTGGTGSGFTAAMFDYLVDYSKLTRIEIPIFPSSCVSAAVVDPYNAVLGEHFCMEDIDLTLMIDNEALYGLMGRYMSQQIPTYTDINRLISQTCSTCTASTRFANVLYNDISVLTTNLVPYPRIHFPVINIAPLSSASRALHEACSVDEITRMVFDRDNQMLKVDPTKFKYMSCCLMYRGDVNPTAVYRSISHIKDKRSINFVDWCPTGFKIGINLQPQSYIPGSHQEAAPRSVTMLTNTAAVGQVVTRLTNQFQILYSKRSFVHWFVGEGLEESELTESLYNLYTLVKDYEEVSKDTKDITGEEVNDGFDEKEANLDLADTAAQSIGTYVEEKLSFKKFSTKSNERSENRDSVQEQDQIEESAFDKSQQSIARSEKSLQSQVRSEKSLQSQVRSEKSLQSQARSEKSLQSQARSEKSNNSQHSTVKFGSGIGQALEQIPHTSEGSLDQNSQKDQLSIPQRSPSPNSYHQSSNISQEKQASYESQHTQVSKHSSQQNEYSNHVSQASQQNAYSNHASQASQHSSHSKHASLASQHSSHGKHASLASQHSSHSKHASLASQHSSHGKHASLASQHSSHGKHASLASQHSSHSKHASQESQQSPHSKHDSQESQQSPHSKHASQESQQSAHSKQASVESRQSSNSHKKSVKSSQGSWEEKEEPEMKRSFKETSNASNETTDDNSLDVRIEIETKVNNIGYDSE